MFKKFVTIIATLCVTFTTNLYAEEVIVYPIQVAPSAINLDAKGVTVVTIQTLFKYNDCIESVPNEEVPGGYTKSTTLGIDLSVDNADDEIVIEDEEDNWIGFFNVVYEDDVDGNAICDPEVDDLCFTADRLGHVVVRIVSWDRSKDEIPPGDATFKISGHCTIDGNEVEVSGMDDALIISK
ncbi:MAG: hypothetical protein PVG22_14870 [Chromatiales bacterium]